MTPEDFPRVLSQGVTLVVLDNTDSTNRHLIDNPGPTDAWSVVITDHQTSGRGRAGRQWSSLPGRGLALSIQLPASLVPRPLGHGWLGWLSLLVGTALAEAIAGLVSDGVSVKWPNDVHIDGKKVAGILGEISTDSRVVVGIGVNLFYETHELPTPESTSLGLHQALPTDIPDRLVSAVLDSLMTVMPRAQGPIPADIREWVEARLGTLHREVRVSTPSEGTLVGVASGLAEDGSLIIQRQGSRSEVVVSVGDIEHLRHE
jgi:BirA family biotin operon repressor/biotin-[acetyl-CoA-carboxylase] ligase